MRRGRRRIARLALLCAVILSASLAFPAVSASAYVPEDSIVYVGGFDGDENLQFIAFGTAMTVDGELRIMTANGPANLNYKVALLYGDTDVGAKIYASHAEHGLMIVSLDEPFSELEAASSYSAKEAEEGTQVETMGRVGIDSGSFGARIDSVNGNTIRFTLDSPCDSLGAPLCYSDGSVFAFVTSSGGGIEGKATSVDVFHKDGGSGGISGGAGGKDDAKDTLLKFGIPALVVVVLAGGFLLYRSKAKRTVQQVASVGFGAPYYAPQTPSDSFAQAQTPPNSFMQPTADSIASTQPITPLSAQAAPQAHISGVRGTGGQYNTMSFPIKDRAVLGRDASRCGIVFDATTPGVSSVHCEIIRVGAGLQIVDRGSSYGTYVNGTRLQVNLPADIGLGGVFYLGDKRNSFTVY